MTSDPTGDDSRPPGAADDPFDPFREDREGTGAMTIEVDGEKIVTVLGHRDLKAAARDWETFSSDAPFRVPIPAEHRYRSVRQLPIETDPPDHRDYRDIVREPFSRATATRITPDIRAVVDELLDAALAGEATEVVRAFALPLQARSLALMLGRPPGDAEQWITWGIDVFKDTTDASEGHADDLDQYLEGVIEAAVDEPGDDFFGLLARGQLHGRALTRNEMLGFANLVFAGGRDTVINLVSNALAHLCDHPESLAALRDDPLRARAATEELLRFYSPLTLLGRVARHDTEVHGCPVGHDQRIALAYASANRDETVFDRAGDCVLDRHPNRHVAFGHGPHTCLGAPLARAIMTTLLERVALRVGSLTRLEATPLVEDFGTCRRQVGFSALRIRFDPPGGGAPVPPAPPHRLSTAGRGAPW